MTVESKTDWTSIVRRGIESDELDYKAAQNWRELNRRDKAKFARHCMALANTKGGYIVVGVGEDKAGRPNVYTGLTNEQLKSFDITDVGNFINQRVDPSIDFDIVRPKVKGKSYVIFVVRRFKGLPHVCTGYLDDELQQGCFYIRTQDASSRVAYRANEIHDLVQRAMRNQREVLGRMIRGLLYEKGLSPDPPAESLFREEIKNAWMFLNRNAKSIFSNAFFEISAFPTSFNNKAFGPSEIKKAVQNSAVSFLNNPFVFMENEEEIYFTNVSLRSLSVSQKVYFQAFRSGQFHYVSALSEKKDLELESIIQLICGSFIFLADYYNALGYEDEVISINLRIVGTDKRKLLLENTKPKQQFVCRIPEIHSDMKRSAADLAAGLTEHTVRAFRNILYCFNIPESRHQEIRSRIEEFLSRRL